MALRRTQGEQLDPTFEILVNDAARQIRRVDFRENEIRAPAKQPILDSASRTQSVRKPIALPRVAAFNQTGIGAVVRSVELRPAQSNGS
jgi:hypothetical protein